MAFHKVTEHETMGYCPHFGSVSDQPPATYWFHVLSKMNSVVKNKCLLQLGGGNTWEHWQAAGAQQERDRLGWPWSIPPAVSALL